MASSVSPGFTVWIRPAAEPPMTSPPNVANATILRHIGHKINRMEAAALRVDAAGAAGLGQALGAEAAELVVAGVDEAHGLCPAVMSGLVPDEAPHLQAH